MERLRGRAARDLGRLKVRQRCVLQSVVMFWRCRVRSLGENAAFFVFMLCKGALLCVFTTQVLIACIKCAPGWPPRPTPTRADYRRAICNTTCIQYALGVIRSPISLTTAGMCCTMCFYRCMQRAFPSLFLRTPFGPAYQAKAGMSSVDSGDVDLATCAANAAPGAIEEARLLAGARAGFTKRGQRRFHFEGDAMCD